LSGYSEAIARRDERANLANRGGRRGDTAISTGASRKQAHVGSQRGAQIFDLRRHLARDALRFTDRLDEVEESSA
jgi:hypothetical protein